MSIRKYVIERKVRTAKTGLDRLIREGLEQTAKFMDRVGAESGHFVIFDLRPGVPWEQRLYRKDPEPDQRPVMVRGSRPSPTVTTVQPSDGRGASGRALRHSHANGHTCGGFKLKEEAFAGCVLTGARGKGGLLI